MNEVIQFLVQAFRDLPDGLKLLLFVGLIACLVILAIWKYVSWRRLKDITKALRRKEEKLHNATKDRDQLQARLDALDKVDEHVWARPDSLRQNRFTSRAERRTRFVAVCNLKGGVCKTTLTLNLGVGLALAGKRVLLVDFDFQATLSNFLLAED